MKRREFVNKAVATIPAAGFEPYVICNKHWKVSWLDQQNRRHCLIIPASPSDYRGRLNSRAVLRRLLWASAQK